MSNKNHFRRKRADKNKTKSRKPILLGNVLAEMRREIVNDFLLSASNGDTYLSSNVAH